jgi:AcrR family transcriptional regulator
MVTAPHYRRVVPTQARSRATVGKILDAAALALTNDGLPGFTTNAVADAAGVNIATLYHYFPDKNAVLRELFDRFERERLGEIKRRLGEFATTDDIGAWLDDIADAMLERRRQYPASMVLRRAIRSIPALSEAEDDLNRELSTAMAVAIAARYPHLPAHRSRSVGRTVILISKELLDAAADDAAAGRSTDAPLQREAVAAIRGYLRDVADDSG